MAASHSNPHTSHPLLPHTSCSRPPGVLPRRLVQRSVVMTERLTYFSVFPGSENKPGLGTAMQSDHVNEETEAQSGVLTVQTHRSLAVEPVTRFSAPCCPLPTHSMSPRLLRGDLPRILSSSCRTVIFPTSLPPGNLRPQPPGSCEGPSFLTSAALGREAKETQLASVAGLALNAWAAGALPCLKVALLLLGAQRVALAAMIREGTCI